MNRSIIAAYDLNYGIGFHNKLPWNLQDDLKRFRFLTMGHHLIMGRKTYESIGRPLPGRVSIVLSKTLNKAPKYCLLASTIGSAIEIAEKAGE